MEFTGGSPQADHLCVLVHGLWGNPNHMKNVAKSLRARFSDDELYIHVPKGNSGSFTYDGIELGGERVCAEIIEELRAIEDRGGKITKLSIVGYSMGGLIARYAVGLLFAKGALDSVACMNFATFASPHLGSRSPGPGWLHDLWNFLGARTIAASGQQLFIVDDYRHTGRPLLAVMADPDSIFMNGLRRFKRHTLYSNIVNDRTTVYFTTCIEKTDPYKNLPELDVKFVDGYQGLVVDVSDDSSPPRLQLLESTTPSSVMTAALGRLRSIPTMIALCLLLPIGAVVFLLMSAIQTVQSSRRIRLHRERAGFNVHEYRIPFLIQDLKGGVEHAIEVLNSSKKQAHLEFEGRNGEAAGLRAMKKAAITRKRRVSVPGEPALALTQNQLEMYTSLNELNWRKYPVWIKSNSHAHAVIVVRSDWTSFSDGWLILKHFSDSEFLI